MLAFFVGYGFGRIVILNIIQMHIFKINAPFVLLHASNWRHYIYRMKDVGVVLFACLLAYYFISFYFLLRVLPALAQIFKGTKNMPFRQNHTQLCGCIRHEEKIIEVKCKEAWKRAPKIRNHNFLTYMKDFRIFTPDELSNIASK